MTRSKDHKNDEDLQGIIKSLKREIKSLNQEIAQLHKSLGYSQNKTEKTKRVKEINIEPNCPDCSKGILKEITLVGKIFIICPICNYRRKS